MSDRICQIYLLNLRYTYHNLAKVSLQFISPTRYNSEFSASILSMVFSNKLSRSLDELGGLYHVPTKNGLES